MAVYLGRILKFEAWPEQKKSKLSPTIKYETPFCQMLQIKPSFHRFPPSPLPSFPYLFSIRLLWDGASLSPFGPTKPEAFGALHHGRAPEPANGQEDPFLDLEVWSSDCNCFQSVGITYAYYGSLMLGFSFWKNQTGLVFMLFLTTKNSNGRKKIWKTFSRGYLDWK